MSTDRFNTLVVRVARRLQEPQAASAGYLTGTYDRYSAVLVGDYINDAIREWITGKVMELGDRFADVVPEMTRSVAPLTLATGTLVKPADFLFPLGMRVASSAVFFRLLRGRDVTSCLAGVDPAIAGTTTEPVYYIEGSNILTRGVVSGNVELRYIIKHQDITISVAAAGNGKWYTGSNGAYTVSTRRLTGTFSTALAAGDVGKRVVFRSSTKVYAVRITSFVDATNVTVDGPDLPAADITTGNVLQALVSDIEPSTADLQLSEHWWPEITELAVRRGILDAQRRLLQTST